MTGVGSARCGRPQRLELLLELVPALRLIAVLRNPSTPI